MIVVWRITQRCNLGCPFCNYDRALKRPRAEADVAVVKNFGAALSHYQRESGERVLVSWIGGEPLLWPQLEEVTEYFTGELDLNVGATTNGTTLGSASMREHIVACYTELTVSVDAPGAAHDVLRGWRGGFDSLSTSLPALARLKRTRGRGPLLRVNTVLMHDTLGDFESLCLQLADWGVEEITFNQLGGRDRPEFFPEHRLRPSDVVFLEEKLPALRSRLAARGVRLAGGAEYLRRIRASTLDEHLPVHDCLPGEKFLFVDERGEVAPCNYTSRELGLPIADLNPVGGVSSLAGRFAEARQKCGRLAACEDCHSTQVWEKFAR